MTTCVRELSKSTLEALSQFYNERDDRQKQFERLKAQAADDADFSSISMELFAEDWNASQFWVCSRPVLSHWVTITDQFQVRR
jgi:hypothetical protein